MRRTSVISPDSLMDEGGSVRRMLSHAVKGYRRSKMDGGTGKHVTGLCCLVDTCSFHLLECAACQRKTFCWRDHSKAYNK